MLITEEYRVLNARKFIEGGGYGTSGHRYAYLVRAIADRANTRDILDYGCGRRTLETELGFPISNYDPCISGLDSPPTLHDVVACTDVLEHIEPECLDAVLDDLRRVTKIILLLVVFTGPAKKTLADGRNAHLIQEKFKWWKPRIESRFKILTVQEQEKSFCVICKPL